MRGKSTYHLTDEEVTWAVVDLDDLPRHVREHLAQCQSCAKRVGLVQDKLNKISEFASRSVPSVQPQPILSYKKARASFPGFVWTRAGLSAALSGLFLVVAISIGVAVLYRYGGQGQGTTLIEEIRKDAILMSEVDRLIEDPLPSIYKDISGEDSESLDRGFMDFIVPMPVPGDERPGKA